MVSGMFIGEEGKILIPNSMLSTVEETSFCEDACLQQERIYKVAGTLKADQYLHILQNTMFNAQQRRFKVLIWPPQSADLNPIENLLKILNLNRDQSSNPSSVFNYAI